MMMMNTFISPSISLFLSLFYRSTNVFIYFLHSLFIFFQSNFSIIYCTVLHYITLHFITIQVAVKVHQLNPTWSEERKQSYIKHVTREYTIHRDMKHPRVVQLFDVFEIDINSFATVLEYCKGIDLDEK